MTIQSSHKADRLILNLAGARIRGTDLSHADLANANLSDADCSYVSFRGADMKDANLKGTLLIRADLTDVKNLTRTQINAAVIDESTVLPGYIRAQA